MHLRSTTVTGKPGLIDDGVAVLRDAVLPTLERTDGCIGLSLLADRESGRCIAATAWESKEAMRGTVDGLAPLTRALGGDDADEAEWEIAIVHREHPAAGAGAQVAWARIQPGHIDDLVEAYRSNLMPKLAELPGFCSVSLMVDRRSGRTVSVTCFTDPAALHRVRKEARSLREQFARAMGARVVDVAEMEMVSAHLRVPETA